METETTEFVIEKGIQKVGTRGPRAIKHPDFIRIKATTDKMQRGDSFLFPLNGHKIWTIKAWLKKISKVETEKILDLKVRERSPIVFSSVPVRDALGNINSVRIFRDL